MSEDTLARLLNQRDGLEMAVKAWQAENARLRAAIAPTAENIARVAVGLCCMTEHGRMQTARAILAAIRARAQSETKEGTCADCAGHVMPCERHGNYSSLGDKAGREGK